jgi:acyl-CoA carboxylase subunit beta
MTAETTADRCEVEWVRCEGCSSLVYGRRLERNLDVCPECGDHRRLTAEQRVRYLADVGSFVPLSDAARSIDVLGFTDSVPYPRRLEQARKATGMADAVLCGTATICGEPTVLVVMDFRFLGGSLGVAVGEMVCRAAEVALRRELPLVFVTASGGARMQEGCLSLMQMASTSQAVARLQDAGLLTVSVVTDPTYGGVAASFATNTDVVIAESGARMGFAGPRVIRQTIREELPEGFQTADFLLEHGQVDLVVERRELPARLASLLAAARRDPAGPARSRDTGPAPVVVRASARSTGRDPWETVQLARHAERPSVRDHIDRITEWFVELHGDRLTGDCPAMVTGLGRLDGYHVAIAGQQKGHTTPELVASNFGMAKPEGYRKALRVMRLAARLGLPVLTLVDTPGAHPGVDAEERGQAQAIAQSILAMCSLPVPVVAVVTGEGGSGGALALCVADQVLMAENGTYSVISPEGCSSILWNTAAAAREAAAALALTAPDLLRLGVLDGIVPEPPGGAHADPAAASTLLRRAVLDVLPPLLEIAPSELVERRRERFRRYGDVAGVARRAAGRGPSSTLSGLRRSPSGSPADVRVAQRAAH